MNFITLKRPAGCGRASPGMRLPALVWLALFALWTLLVMSGWLAAPDLGGLLLFRNPADSTQILGPVWLTAVVGVLTEAGASETVVVLGSLLVAAVWYRVGYAPALKILAAIVSWMALIVLLKQAVGRPRPDLVGHLSEVVSLSYPSGHAARAALLYAVMAQWLPRLTRLARAPVLFICLGLIVVVGVSRVFLGVHWPSDVIGSWLLAAFWLRVWWPLPPPTCAADPQAPGPVAL